MTTHDEISVLAKELGFEFVGMSGMGRRKFQHPVTKKIVFAAVNKSFRSLKNTLADLRRASDQTPQGREVHKLERVERRHKKACKTPGPRLVVNETELKEAQKIEHKSKVLQNQLNLLFKEAASRKMSPEQTVAFAHTYLRITFKNFHTTEKEVRDAYDIHRGNASFVHRMFQPGSRGGWHRIG